MLKLTAAEARILGALMEKAETTPEYYPLSLNALVNACNQKSNRDPVMELGEAEVREALFALEQHALVRVQADGRVSKFEHRAYDALKLGRAEVAVLCGLLLRGPQTAAELRGRAERMYSFDDTAATSSVLERMAACEVPLVQLTAKLPGAREARWCELLSGERSPATTDSVVKVTVESEVLARIEQIETALNELQRRLSALENPRAQDAESGAASS